MGWTHFFNLFLMMFIIRSGIQILCDQTRLYFSRNSTPGQGRVAADREACAE